MAYEVVWTETASLALVEIGAYIRRESPAYAETVVRQLVDRADKLNELPLRGRIVPELGRADTREIFIYSYRLIYRVIESRVYVMNIIHGRRDLSAVDIAGR